YKIPRGRKADLKTGRNKEIIFRQCAEKNRGQRRPEAAEISGQSHGWIKRRVGNYIPENWFKGELNACGHCYQQRSHQVLHPYRPKFHRIRPMSFSIHNKTLSRLCVPGLVAKSFHLLAGGIKKCMPRD